MNTEKLGRRELMLSLTGTLLNGCRPKVAPPQASIQFLRVPQADEGGAAKNDIIQGSVIGARPGQKIVLYAKSGTWWLQPLENEPFTSIRPNSQWTNATHLGTEYAALLVGPGYSPPANIATLPTPGGAVAAVAVARGQKTSPSPTLAFSGYEWRIRTAPSDRGATRNLYEAANAWTDRSGALHLRIAQSAGVWRCAEVSLTRSLGFGTYLFSVRDTSRLDTAAVFGMFTWDYAGENNNNREVAIEMSRWGDPANNNAQYVIQPFHVPTNVFRFSAPPGPIRHAFEWQAGRMSFRSTRSSGSVFAKHDFTSGVPGPGLECVRMNLYVYNGGRVRMKDPAEVVIEKFEYLT